MLARPKNMDNKKIQINRLQQVFDEWKGLLNGLSEEQVCETHLSDWSIKDVIAHLMAWQQISIARLEAALSNSKPVFPDWASVLDIDSEEFTDQVNVLIYKLYASEPWQKIHQKWEEGFTRFLKLAESIPEEDLIDKDKYPWLKGYPLSEVLRGSYEHHKEDHLEPLRKFLKPRAF